MYRSILLAAALTIGTAGSAAPKQAPPNEALIERFLNAIASDSTIPTQTTAIEAKDEEALAALNPGRLSEIREIMRANHVCVDAVTRTATRQAFRQTANDLGSVKVSLLVAFYEGPDRQRMRDLIGKQKSGGSLTNAEQVELSQMLDRYPLIEMLSTAKAHQNVLLASADTLTAWRHCGDIRNADLVEQGIKLP